jgi:hypothetical protein
MQDMGNIVILPALIDVLEPPNQEIAQPTSVSKEAQESNAGDFSFDGFDSLGLNG